MAQVAEHLPSKLEAKKEKEKKQKLQKQMS
jgi:hypothetical protein